MSYDQWISVTITAGNYTIKISDAQLQWGKFYQAPNMDNELSPAQIDQISIAPGTSATISSCGREGAGSGTQGSFEVYDGTNPNGLIYVGTFIWNCPWGTPNNTWYFDGSNPPSPYTTETSGGSMTGPIGEVTMKSSKEVGADADAEMVKPIQV